MTVEAIRMGQTVAADSTAQAAGAAQEEHVEIDFKNPRKIGNYETDTKSNNFLKEYLLGKAQSQGVKIPEGMSISVSSPAEYSEAFRALLRSVRVDIYGARVADMFKLLVKDPEVVEKRVAEMKISDEEKAKIIALKALFDDYYHIEANYNGKAYNLLDLTDEDKAELREISPEFAQFLENEEADLKDNATKFTQGELEHLELSAAAEDSKKAVPILLGVLGTLGVKEVISAYKDRKAAMKDPSAFLAEQKALSRNKIGVVNPFTDVKSRIKGKKGLAVLLALSPILLNTLSGSIDDISGAAKDYFQDKECFGSAKAGVLAGLSAVAGIATSFVIAGTYENARDILKARRYVKNTRLASAEAAGTLERVNRLRKSFRPSAVQRLLKGGKFALGAGLFGMVVASCTSGSSWASMAGTRFLFGQNGDKLAEKNIIDKEDNTFENSNKNMMKYEAYSGKWHGIATGPTSDPVVGFTLGATGLLTHPSAVVASTAFATQGCSETLTACGYQLLGGAARENKLERQKRELVESVQPAAQEVPAQETVQEAA